jgi:hypothetical protein
MLSHKYASAILAGSKGTSGSEEFENMTTVNLFLWQINKLGYKSMQAAAMSDDIFPLNLFEAEPIAIFHGWRLPAV